MSPDDARERVHRLFEAYADAPLPDWPGFAAAIQTRRAQQGQVILDETTEVGSYLYLVASGVFQVRVVSPNGTWRTTNFARPGDFMASLPAIEQRPHPPIPPEAADTVVGRAFAAALAERYRLTALTTGAYVEIPLHEMHQRAHRSVPWGRALATAYLVYAQILRYERDRMRGLPEARYRSFLADYAPVLPYLQQKDIADYLGISEVGVSRIASRVRRSQASD